MATQGKMKSNQKVTGIKVDVKIILSSLWIARMLSGLQGDSTRLHDPVALNELLSGTSEIPVTDTMLLVLSIILAIPIVMSFLSLTLKYKANRWANIILGIFYTCLVLVAQFGIVMDTSVNFLFSGIVEVVLTGLIVWYAWKWPKQEA